MDRKKSSMRSLLRQMHRRAEGQSLLEFALILPALILILLGIIQVGAVFTGLLALNAAAREGARQAAVVWEEADAEEQIKSAVERVYPLGLFLGGLDREEDIKIEYPEGGTGAGKPVRVTVSGEVIHFMPLPYRQSGFPEDPESYTLESPLQFSATAVMRLEGGSEPGEP